MTKRQNKSYVLFSIFQIILILTGIIFNYFSLKKMGLMRYLVYRNYELDKMNIKVYLWLILLAFIFAMFLIYKNKKFKVSIDLIFSVILVVIIGLLFNQVLKRFKYDYYYQSFLFIIVSTLQILKLNKKQ
ncbi:MAG: hypothetical protein Q4E02_01635 [Lagierella massiliensis]|nr:hypothetical protein [Lagierella massiliensis]